MQPNEYSQPTIASSFPEPTATFNRLISRPRASISTCERASREQTQSRGAIRSIRPDLQLSLTLTASCNIAQQRPWMKICRWTGVSPHTHRRHTPRSRFQMDQETGKCCQCPVDLHPGEKSRSELTVGSTETSSSSRTAQEVKEAISRLPRRISSSSVKISSNLASCKHRRTSVSALSRTETIHPKITRT